MITTLSSHFFSGVSRFFSGVALSRLSGFCRDFMMIYFFGDHVAVATFYIAFRYAHLLRRCFGEGPLQSAFIPLFEDLRIDSEQQAVSFFRQVTMVIGSIVLGLIVILEGVSIFSVDHEITYLTCWMLPSLLFVSLYGLNVSFLQCYHRFFIANLAPLFCNVMWIIGIYYVRNEHCFAAMQGLSKWVLSGFILQWLVTAWQLRLYVSWREWSFQGVLNRKVYRLLKMLVIGAFGVAVSQINGFFDILFSKYLHPSGPIYFFYATRFYQLGFVLSGLSVVGTLVPVLSRSIKSGSIVQAKKIFSFGCQKIVLFMLPLGLSMIIFGKDALECLFGSTKFSPSAITHTARCLSAYAVGLVPMTFIMYYSSILYAFDKAYMVVRVSACVVLVNIACNSMCVLWSQGSPYMIAFVTSILSWGHCFWMRSLLKEWRSDMKRYDYFQILASIIAALLCSYLIRDLCSFAFKWARFLIPGCTFLGVYTVCLRKRIFDYGATKTNVALVEND